jgi:hypothetical protein
VLEDQIVEGEDAPNAGQPGKEMIGGVEEIDFREHSVLWDAGEVGQECRHPPGFGGQIDRQTGELVERRIHLGLAGPIVEGDVLVLRIDGQQCCHQLLGVPPQASYVVYGW